MAQVYNETASASEIPRHRIQFFNRELVNLESHQLLWCDTNMNGGKLSNFTITVDELRRIVDYTKVFDDIEKCHQCILRTGDTETFLVCFDSFGENLVPRVHHLENIRSVYIFCYEKQHDEHWSSNFLKIKQVYTDLESLLHDLKEDVNAFLQQEKYNIFSDIDKPNRTTQWEITWWRYFIEMLCNLPYPDTCESTFITILKDYYKGKEAQLQTLQEFEDYYDPCIAAFWYTRDTFLYRLLNRALRQNNIEVIFLFGFYIKDLYKQMKNEYQKFKSKHSNEPIVKVYRTQLMSIDEVKDFPKEIIVNSFFSTTTDRSLAVFLFGSLQRQESDLQKVLFEIELDTRMQTRPYGDISQSSAISEEHEVLLMIATKLNVQNVSYDTDTNIHTVKLTLRTDPEAKEVDTLSDTTMKRTLKNCLSNTSRKLDNNVTIAQLNTIFSELNELFPTEKGWMEGAKYWCIGFHYWQKQSPQEAISNYEQAIAVYEQYLDDNELDTARTLARIHCDIALINQTHLTDKVQAIKHYDLAANCCVNSLQKTVDQKRRFKLCETILSVLKWRETATLFDKNEMRETQFKAIGYRKLQLEDVLKCFPPEHDYVDTCIENLVRQQDPTLFFDEALNNYEEIIKIYHQQDTAKFHDIALTYRRMADMYIEEKEDYSTALHYKTKELEYLVKDDAINPILDELAVQYLRPRTALCHQELADIHLKLACEHLTMAKSIYECSDYKDKEVEIKEIDEKLKNIEIMKNRTHFGNGILDELQRQVNCIDNNL